MLSCQVKSACTRSKSSSYMRLHFPKEHIPLFYTPQMPMIPLTVVPLEWQRKQGVVLRQVARFVNTACPAIYPVAQNVRNGNLILDILHNQTLITNTVKKQITIQRMNQVFHQITIERLKFLLGPFLNVSSSSHCLFSTVITFDLVCGDYLGQDFLTLYMSIYCIIFFSPYFQHPSLKGVC